MRLKPVEEVKTLANVNFKNFQFAVIVSSKK